jgi:hypothetical protein
MKFYFNFFPPTEDLSKFECAKQEGIKKVSPYVDFRVPF